MRKFRKYPITAATKDTEYDIQERIDYMRDLLDDALNIDFADVPEGRLSRIRDAVDNMYQSAHTIESALKAIRERR